MDRATGAPSNTRVRFLAHKVPHRAVQLYRSQPFGPECVAWSYWRTLPGRQSPRDRYAPRCRQSCYCMHYRH
jgi:hypothetical protein